MTLSRRNCCFRAGIALSAICLSGIVSHASRLLPLYPELAEQADGRTDGIFQQAAALFLPAVPQAPFTAAAAAAVYALAAPLLIYIFFEKTQSPEALFFGLFPVSFAFESLRLALPLRTLYELPGLFLVAGARILFFGRFFGALSFFAAGLYAAGFETQKQGTVMFAVLIAPLVISMGIPVDSLTWNTGLIMVSGYAPVFRLAESGIIAVSVATFFAAAVIRDSGEYPAIAWGALLVSVGRGLLLNTDTWLVIPGFVILCAGSWIAAAKLRQVYLWL